MPEEPLRVVVAESTASVNDVIAEVISGIPHATVSGRLTSLNGVLPHLSRNDTDLIVLSDAGGMALVNELRVRYPQLGIILICDASRASASLALEAIRRGALGFVRRPAQLDPGASQAEVVRQLLPLVSAHVTRQRTAAPPLGTESALRSGPDRILVRKGTGAPPARFGLVAIGISTGGPQALGALLPELPSDLEAPVLIVQHMPPGFTDMMARTLDQRSPLHVREAAHGDRPVPGEVLIAPGGKHMTLEPNRGSGYTVALNEDPPVNACRPAADVLFRSIARHYRGNVLALVMTGMGQDGRDGVQALKQGNCYCLTQSEASCVVYGMPAMVDEAGLSDERVPLAMMARRVTSLVRGYARHPAVTNGR